MGMSLEEARSRVGETVIVDDALAAPAFEAVIVGVTPRGFVEVAADGRRFCVSRKILRTRGSDG